MEEDGMDWKGK